MTSGSTGSTGSTGGATTEARRALTPEAQAYLDGVAVHLADLQVEDRTDLLEELEAHLAELSSEGDAPLVSRLGAPGDYAAELRAAAGLPAAATRSGAAVGQLLGQVLAHVQRLRRRPSVIGAATTAVALKPVWWLVRSWVLAALVARVLTAGPWSSGYPFVPVIGSPFGGLLAILALLALSVRLDRRSSDVRTTWALAAVDVVALVALLPALSSAHSSNWQSIANAVDIQSSAAATASPGQGAEGVYSGGKQIWNVYPYDDQGRLLHDVRLYDQDGGPIGLGLAYDATKKQTLDVAGRPVDNAFPYRYVDPSSGQVIDMNAAPDVTAPPLLGIQPTVTSPASPASTPAPTPAATTSSSPTPTPSTTPTATSSGKTR